MPKYTTTLEVELEVTFGYAVQHPDKSVGDTDVAFAIWVSSIKHLKLLGNPISRELEDELCSRVEDEIRRAYLEGEG